MQYSRNDHQQHARWRMTFTFLCLLGIFASLCSSAPTGGSEPKIPTLERLVDSSKDSSLSERVGSPIELAWQAWLILSKSEKGPILSEDPATLVRRITPKSIFIAPELNSGCSGLTYDENRCKHVKTINVNTSLQRKFLLDRLNAKHDRQKQQEQEQSKIYDFAGPFQLTIPLNKGANDEVVKVQTTTTTTEAPKIQIPEVKVSEIKKVEEPVKVEESMRKVQESLPEHVPVVDFVHEESNESFIDSVVDYKIPSSAKIADEKKEEDEEEVITTVTTTTESTTTQKYVPPTLIVLFNVPTKAPVKETLDTKEIQDTKETLDAKETLEEMVKNITGKDFLSSIIPIENDEQDSLTLNVPRNVTQDVFGVNATQENDDVYSDEDLLVLHDDNQEDYSTEDSMTESLEDDFAETTEDELLRPGEAGMTIPIMTNHKEDFAERTTETPEIFTVKPLRLETTVKPLRVETTVKPLRKTTIKPEDTEASISSEVSINGDFILETTLVDVNTEKIKNSSVDFVTMKIDPSDDRFESEKELLPKPEVVFSISPLDQHPQQTSQVEPVIVWSIDQEKLLQNNAQKQSKHSSSQSNHSLMQNNEPPKQTNYPLMQNNFPPIQNPSMQNQNPLVQNNHPLVQTSNPLKQSNDPLKLNLGLASEDSIDPQASYNSEKIVLPDPAISLANYKQQQQNLGFVRFPNFEERPFSSYVRFPSDEVNSIHNLDFKPRVPHSREESTSTKSSVPFFQKQSLWHRGSRTDRQHSGFKQHRQPKTKQQTSLQDFWAKVPPIIPDLMHLPMTSRGSNNEPHGGDRRSRFKAT